MPRTTPAIDRFHSYYRVDPDGCWVWVRHRNHDGYGIFKPVGCRRVKRREFAHRWSYQQFVGTLSEDLEIDHLCRNRACVNPTHLELVTHEENMRRSRGFSTRPRKTVCPRGHEKTGDNLYVTSKGAYNCRKCSSDGQGRRVKERRQLEDGFAEKLRAYHRAWYAKRKDESIFGGPRKVAS